MELDLVKGGPPTYTNYGDMFVSDSFSGFSQTTYIYIPSWNSILCASNTSNEPVLLTKIQPADKWVPTEIESDNRRPILPSGDTCIGGGTFLGISEPLVISETESFPPMPLLFFITSQGVLSSFYAVNTQPTPTLCTPVPNAIPASLVTVHKDPVKVQEIPNVQASPSAAPIASQGVSFSVPSSFGTSSLSPSTKPPSYSASIDITPVPVTQISNFATPTIEGIAAMKQTIETRREDLAKGKIIQADSNSGVANEPTDYDYACLLKEIEVLGKRLEKHSSR